MSVLATWEKAFGFHEGGRPSVLAQLLLKPENTDG